MKKFGIRTILTVTLLSLGLAAPSFGADKATGGMTEEKLIADMSSKNEATVLDALANIERKFPTTTAALPKMRELLGDSRLEVKAKSARVLGVIHAPVEENDLKNITTL